jgi:hypothetical protein
MKGEEASAQPSGWRNVGIVAIASAVLGGMAAAWWYRKTLIRFRQAEEIGGNPQFGISGDNLSDES